MESFNKNLARFSLTLTLVCAVAAGLLALVNSVTSVKIEENNRIELAKKRAKVIPGADKFEEKVIDGRVYAVAYDAAGNAVGTAFQVNPRGYGGAINITMGIKKDNILSGIAISKLDQSETPGLGIKITTPKFQEQFSGKTKEQIALKKDGGAIDAITAATISSKAVVTGVLSGFEQYKTDSAKLYTAKVAQSVQTGEPKK